MECLSIRVNYEGKWYYRVGTGQWHAYDITTKEPLDKKLCLENLDCYGRLPKEFCRITLDSDTAKDEIDKKILKIIVDNVKVYLYKSKSPIDRKERLDCIPADLFSKPWSRTKGSGDNKQVRLCTSDESKELNWKIKHASDIDKYTALATIAITTGGTAVMSYKPYIIDDNDTNGYYDQVFYIK